ncbi:hypothetical protein PR003_g23846 [Phytophthora rubi]|uniref:Uncharacterized protein n=1 Tax=Phytophthora rubi TaxID=129364 RepID=A0A6A3HIS9_9STRA|nr:hypothetical protein PR002_g27393 [Phytophthora rubi]KAE9296077.1 hypothetical protein PR003_g23846 [Phytophthora rubi]
MDLTEGRRPLLNRLSPDSGGGREQPPEEKVSGQRSRQAPETGSFGGMTRAGFSPARAAASDAGLTDRTKTLASAGL